MRVGDLFAVLHLDRKGFSTGLAMAKGEAGGLGTMVGKVALGMGIAIAAVGGIAIKMAGDFQASMANVQTLIGAGSESDARIKEVGEGIKVMSMETGKSLDDLSNGLYEVIGTFGDGADTLGLLDVAARAGAAGLSTTQDAVRLLASLTKSYGDTSVEAARKTSDLIFQTVNLGVTTLPELASSMGRVIPTAAALGVSMEELMGLYAGLTGLTGSTDEVTTALRGTMTALIKPSNEMAEALRELGYAGVNAGQDIISERGIHPAIQALAGTAVAADEGIGKLWRNTNTLGTVLAMVGPEAESIAAKIEAVGDASGATAEAFALQQGSVAGLQAKVSAAISVMMVDLGEKLLPVVEKVLTWIIANWPAIAKTFQTVADAIGTTVAAVVTVIAKLVEVINFLKPGIIAVGAVIFAAMIPALVSMAIAAGAAAIAMAIAFAVPAAIILALVATVAAAALAINYFAMDFGEMGDKLHGIAERTGVDFNQVKEVTRALMDEFGLSFEEATARAEASMERTNGAYDEAAVHAEASGKRRSVSEKGVATDTEIATARVNAAMAGSTDVIVTETEEAEQAISDFSRDALTTLQELEEGMRTAGTDSADAWLDPIQTNFEIAAAEAELGSKEMRENLASEDPNIVRDAQLRTATLTAQLIELKNQAALQGNATAQIAKTKALQTSQFMINGLASEDKEIAATFQLWYDELDEHITDMETAARNSQIGSQLAKAIAAQSGLALHEAQVLANNIRGIFPSSEPKDPNSPFRGITQGWGIGQTLADGFGRSLAKHDFAGLFRGSMTPVAVSVGAAERGRQLAGGDRRDGGGGGDHNYTINGVLPGDVMNEVIRAERRLANEWGIS